MRKQWYYADAQGSISAVADNSGNLLEAYEYNPQGQFQVTNASGTVETATLISNYILYTGRNYDFETGNYFYRARYYSPDLGRFISRDPLSGAEFSQGTNLYAYCQNNYLNLSDPEEKNFLLIAAAVVAIVAIPIIICHEMSELDKSSEKEAAAENARSDALASGNINNQNTDKLNSDVTTAQQQQLTDAFNTALNHVAPTPPDVPTTDEVLDLSLNLTEKTYDVAADKYKQKVEEDAKDKDKKTSCGK